MDDEGVQKLDLLVKQALLDKAGSASVTTTPVMDPVGRPSDQISPSALSSLSSVLASDTQHAVPPDQIGEIGRAIAGDAHAGREARTGES